ncbi:MAG: HAMP domain-containing histidine kinase [Firmicutes bacterium]|nr:HAMP domain-containing histidine kinase [Bacillota bacterium]
MSNNVYLRKYLLKSLCAIMFFIILLCLVNKVEYNKYKYNTNQKINGIVAKIQEKYPEIGKEEIIEILNSNNKDNVFNEYGYDINKDSYINQNNEVYIKFNILKIFILLLSFMILIYLFVRYYFKRDNEIEKIIKCLEKINQKNYEIDINDVSEDKLSILKHEIYKTTVMLKENTEKGNQDKINLKKSLQDISHQLKTPLTSSIIMLDNIIDDLENDIEIKPEFIKKVKKDISKISFLIQSILKLSMLESNTITFIRKEIPVKKIINSSIENIENLCDLKNIKIVVKDRSKKKIYCDYRWQVEALTNILKNAVDYSFNDSIIIVEVDNNNTYTQIKIKDFGKGMSEDETINIFKRFYKGKNSSSDSNGIGLSLAKAIIEKDNGRVIVNSLKGEGTTFSIKYFK